MDKDEYLRMQDEVHKQRLIRYGKVFNNPDGQWVLEDLKNKTIYNIASSKQCVGTNNPLATAHLAGARDIIAWVCTLLMTDDYTPPEPEGDLHASDDGI